MKTVKLGFVGAGYMGQLAHLATFSQVPGVELVALAEGRPQLAHKVADRYGIAEVYPDHRALLEKADVDAVIAIMSFDLHHAVVPDILQAGKHLLTEKPICLDPQTAQEMVDLAARQGVIYQVGYMKRADAGSRYVREQVARWTREGTYGALRYVRCTGAMNDWVWNCWKHLTTDEVPPAYPGVSKEAWPAWMDEKAGRDYISFINFYVHQVNLISYLAGQSYHLDYVSPDAVLLAGAMESGAPLVIECGTNHIKQQWQERYTLSFEKAEIELDLPAPLHHQMVGRVSVKLEGETGPVVTTPFLGMGWSFQDQATLFVDALRGGPVLSPAAEAVADLKVSEQFIKLWQCARGVSDQ